ALMLPLALVAFLLATALASACADSGLRVDSWNANKLDPSAGADARERDPRGTSWLVAGNRRTPGGNLYLCPAEPWQPTADDGWQVHGLLDFGYLGTFGDDTNALWKRYADWNSGPLLGLLDVSAVDPVDGRYANARASRISEDDAYYQAAYGRAGAYKIHAFLRALPDTLSNNAKSIWNGAGSDALTLAGGLLPADSTPEQVAAVSQAAPERRLAVTRRKQGAGVEMYLSPHWRAYANVSDEQRKGARPYGGTFFFNYPFAANGGVLETVKPVDDSTILVDGGLRYAGTVWRADFAYSGSFYRDRYRRFTYQMPFALSALAAGASAAPLTTGQFATEPDNDYHNLRVTLTRKLPLNGEFSLSAAGGRMTQDDMLIAPVDCQGVFGFGSDGSLEPGPQNPFLHACADWNSPDALSRKSADMRIDTSMVDARMTLQPRTDVSLHAGIKANREDYRNTYLAFNPLTGQYGYIAENGARNSIVPGLTNIWDSQHPSVVTPISSLPLDDQRMQADIGADWRPGAHDTLSATWDLSRDEPGNRERRRVDDNRLKLGWVHRGSERLTLRTNYSHVERSGDDYVSNPYAFTSSTALPGFIAPANGVPAYTVDALRLYDLADRNEDKLDLMATVIPRADMTLSASLRGDRNRYDATIGRQRLDTFGFTLQWEWQPTPATRASVYYGYDVSRLRLANVNEINDLGSDPALGGSTYPDDGRWQADDRQRDDNAGITFAQQVGRVRFDAVWNYINARGITRYRFATPAALAYFQDADLVPGNAFPPMTYRVDALTLGLTIPLLENVSLRVFDYYELARVNDWHYAGLDRTRVIDHRVYTDGGPRGYSANVVGLLVDVRL
ncbi:MAG: MtrB/PioB family outer membrane beta-barrel protein, partial [Rhodanobacteraceae bacterium]